MRCFIAFLKKEMKENMRNYRFFIMLVIFSIFGMMSPLFAKFTPELVKSFVPNLTEAFKTPVQLDSWMQFYKNVSQLGLSLTIILFSSCLSGEYAKGTLTIMLTKGLPRPAVILAKFTASAIILTISFWLAFGITYGYTAYLWPTPSVPHVFFAAFALWLEGLLYLCVLMLGCVLFRQAFTSIIFLLAVTAAFGLSGQIKLTAPYSPSVLITKNVDLLSGIVSVSEFIVPIILSVVISGALLCISIAVYNRKQL